MQKIFIAHGRLKNATEYFNKEVLENLWDIWYHANDGEKQEIEAAADDVADVLANISNIAVQCKHSKQLRDAQSTIKTATGTPRRVVDADGYLLLS